MTNLYFPLKASKAFLFTSIFSFFSINISNAQEVEKHLIYYSNEANIGNFIGFSGDLNYIYNEKYSAKIGVISNIRRSPNEPSDYNAGLANLVTFGLIGPFETLAGVNLQVGKIYYLTSKRNSRLNASIGIGYTTLEVVENWQKSTSASLGQNYTYDLVKRDVASLIINPKFEFPLGRVFGFTVSPTAVINAESSYYGVGIGYIIGRIRSKPIRN